MKYYSLDLVLVFHHFVSLLSDFKIWIVILIFCMLYKLKMLYLMNCVFHILKKYNNKNIIEYQIRQFLSF